MPTFPWTIWARTAVLWLLLMSLESVHGALRRVLFSEPVRASLGQVSVLLGTAIVFAAGWFTISWLRIRRDSEAIAVGLQWAAMTLLFELGLGELAGRPWRETLAEYDLARGGLMSLGLVAMALTPWCVFRLRRRRDSDKAT